MLTTNPTMTSREIADIAKFTAGVYACLFSNGTIKVGRGRCIKSRVTAHRSAAACFGITLDWLAFSECGDAPGAEKELIAWCGETSTAQTSREWFQGVDFVACVIVMRSAAATHATAPEPSSTAATDALFNKLYGLGLTREAGAYLGAREYMVAAGIPSEVLVFFDQLHQKSESMRRAVKYGAPRPDWLDALDCFEPWEIEIFMVGEWGLDVREAAVGVIRADLRHSPEAEEAVRRGILSPPLEVPHDQG